MKKNKYANFNIFAIYILIFICVCEKNKKMENLETINPEEAKMLMRVLSTLREDYIHHLKQEKGKYRNMVYCRMKDKEFTVDQAIVEVQQLSEYGLFFLGNYVNTLIVRPTY